MSRKRNFITMIVIAADELPEAEFRAGIEAGQALLKRREPKKAVAARAVARADKAKAAAAKATNVGTVSSEPPPEVVQ